MVLSFVVKSHGEDEFCDEEKGMEDNGLGQCQCIKATYMMNEEETECFLMPGEDDDTNF